MPPSLAVPCSVRALALIHARSVYSHIVTFFHSSIDVQVSLAATHQVCAAGALVAVLAKLGIACSRAGSDRGSVVSVSSFAEVHIRPSKVLNTQEYQPLPLVYTRTFTPKHQLPFIQFLNRN